MPYRRDVEGAVPYNAQTAIFAVGADAPAARAEESLFPVFAPGAGAGRRPCRRDVEGAVPYNAQTAEVGSWLPLWGSCHRRLRR